MSAAVPIKVEEVLAGVEVQEASKKCMICEKEATYCMRGLPQNKYCRPCAEEQFKFLNYLDKLSR